MTFDDDFLLFHLPSGDKRFRCLDLGIQWPPPTTIRLRGFEPPHADLDFRLLSMSSIYDEDRAGMTHVCRGAAYVFASKGIH